MCEKQTFSPGTRVEFQYHETNMARGMVVNQYDTEPYDDTEVVLDQVYSWVENRMVRRFWFLPTRFFPKKVAVSRQLGKRTYLHSSDLRPVTEE